MVAPINHNHAGVSITFFLQLLPLYPLHTKLRSYKVLENVNGRRNSL